LDNPNECKDDREADNGSDRQLDIGIVQPESPEQQDVSATPYVPRFIRPTWKSKEKAEKQLMTVNSMQMMMNRGNKKSSMEWVNVFSPGSLCCLTEISI